MKQYRVEQVTKYLIRFMHRGGRKFKRFKLDRCKFKEWLRIVSQRGAWDE